MFVIAFKLYMLAGMLAHKLLWIAMKRKSPHQDEIKLTNQREPLKVLLPRLVKFAILFGLLAQCLLPYDLVPILHTTAQTTEQTTAQTTVSSPITGIPLIAQHADAWPLRIPGLLLFTLGLAVAVMGRVHLGDNWTDIEQGDVLKEHKVVDRGVYAFIRHPIYAGDLLLLLGLQLAANSWLLVAALLLIPVVLIKTRGEERKLRDSLPGYADYAKRVAGFVPFVY